MKISISPSQQLMTDAVRALSAAARLDSGPDFAEFVTLAVTGAVANVGGVDRALARRPGSWEAAHVRDMLNSSVGDDLATLLEHRTEPLTITVRPEEELNDLGYWQLFDDDESELTRRYDALDLPHTTRHPDGTTTGDSTPWTDEQETAAEAVNGLLDELEQLRARDLTTYEGALREATVSAVATLFPTLSVPADVLVDPAWSERSDPFDELTWLILENARAHAPLPSSAIAPKDYPTGAEIATVERTAGRTPLHRLGQFAA